MNIDEALEKAKLLISQNNTAQALEIYKAILTRVPDQKEAVHGFVTIMQAQQTPAPAPAPTQNNFATVQDAVESLIAQYNAAIQITGSHQTDQLEAVIAAVATVQKTFPDVPFFANIMGVINSDLGRSDAAIRAFETALSLKPDYADALNNLANALKASGQFVAAINAYTEALKHDPENAITINNMGSAFRESGHLQAALDTYVKAAQIKPDFTEVYINIAKITSLMGDLDTSLSAYMKALQLDPTDAEVQNNIGIVYSQKSDFAAAIEAYKKAVDLRPNYAEAYNNLGGSYKAVDNINAAISAFNRAVEIDPNYADAYNNLGVTLKNNDQLDASIAAYQTAIKLTPDRATFHNNLGSALRDKGDYVGSVEAFHKAIELNPDYSEAYNNLGITLRGKFDTPAALEAHRKAIELDGERPTFFNSLGNALNESGNTLDALSAYRQALKIRPDYTEAMKNMAIVLKDRGDFDGAREAFKKILTIKPLFAECTRAIATIANDDDLEHLDRVTHKIIESVSPQSDEWMHASLARSEMHHCNQNFAEAFQLLEAANQYRRTSLNYNLRMDQELFANIRSKFAARQTSLALESQDIKSSTHRQSPIFILGMPRSGTSLVEQVISAHSMVSGYDELEWLRLAILENNGLKRDVDDDLLVQVREAYYHRWHGHTRSDTAYFTDKMPNNFLWIGYLLSAMPEAKIVHVERDPMAVCWSNFKTYFHSLGMGNTFDQSDVANYFKLYQELMAFWRNTYPNRIFDLSYENLTENTQTETQRLFEYLQLPWEASVMEPHKNSRPVRTASSKQVRNEIYKGSSEAWRNYEPWLQPMLKTLNYGSD